MSAIAAIPTVFDGIEYRSRLEATWASFFRKIGWEFTYEPFDGHGYIPDFVIHGEYPFVVEVKPAVTWDQYEEAIPKSVRGLEGVWNRDILIVGVRPDPGLDSNLQEYPVVGLLGEIDTEEISVHSPDCGVKKLFVCSANCRHTETEAWYFQRAPLTWCPDCGRVAILHEEFSFEHRPCGDYDGSWGDPVSTYTLNHHWAEAKNEVKWRGSSR